MTHPVCVCSAQEIVVLLVNAMDSDLAYKDLIRKIICNSKSNKCMMHRCESCPGTATLKEFIDHELNEHEDDEELNYCQWDTTDWITLETITATYKECKETLIDVIDYLTRHSHIAKLKITSSWYKTKSKVTTRVKNTASYISWLYTNWDQVVASNIIHCFIPDDNNHYTSFLHQVQTMLVDHLKANQPHIKN